MKDEGIFSQAWIPGAMNIPASAGKVRRITGAPPGYAYGRPAAAAGFGQLFDPQYSPCEEGQFLAIPSTTTEEPWCAEDCPEGWARVIDESGAKYLCVETPFSIPGMDPKAVPGTPGAPPPPAPPAPPPALPPAPPPPTPPPAPALPPQQTAPPVTTTQPAQPPAKAGVPTWVYVGAGVAVVLVALSVSKD